MSPLPPVNPVSTPAEFVREMARQIKHGWCQGMSAKDSNGGAVWVGSLNACQVCLSGAYSRILGYPIKPNSVACAAWSAIEHHIKDCCAVAWQDAPGRTQQEVLDMLESVAAELEGK